MRTLALAGVFSFWAALPAFGSLNLALSPAPLPTYSYFYTCTSGVENCNDPGFAVDYNGDFGMNGVIADCDPSVTVCGKNGPFGQPGTTHPIGTFSNVVSSNASGEVIGQLLLATFPDEVGFGMGGQIYCAFGCSDYDTKAVAINDNGIYVGNICCGGFIGGIGVQTGNGSYMTLLGDQFGYRYLGTPVGTDTTIQALGINDQNQILLEAIVTSGTGGKSTIEGILSPFVVPELSSIALLATAIGVLGLAGWLWLKRRPSAYHPSYRLCGVDWKAGEHYSWLNDKKREAGENASPRP